MLLHSSTPPSIQVSSLRCIQAFCLFKTCGNAHYVVFLPPPASTKTFSPHLNTIKDASVLSRYNKPAQIPLLTKACEAVCCLEHFAPRAYGLFNSQINRDFRRLQIKEGRRAVGGWRGQPCAWSDLPPKQQRGITPELWSTVAPTKQLCHHNPRELQGGSIDPGSHSRATTANTHTDTHRHR